MNLNIRKVAVIGAGTMGAGIAAHIANANIPVVLIDIAQSGWGRKNAIAEKAIEQLLKADPAPFMHKNAAKLIIASNTDDLKDLTNCDWIIEAIVEKIDIKKQLYEKLVAVCAPHTIISSNTSTIPLAQLIDGLPAGFQQNFLITHFFNPPRYMRLLELVKGTHTLPAVYDAIADFADQILGKGIVDCYDTPGFIANRIGTFWLQTALLTAIKQNITVEEADQLLGKPMGIPKTGVFGLMDLVGIDLMPLIGKSMNEALPADDLYRQTYQEPELIQRMIAGGYTGRKGKGGFYRLIKDNDRKYKEMLDLQTGEYRAEIKPRLASLDAVSSGLQHFLSFPDKGATYARDVMLKVFWYSATLVPEIAGNIYSIDTAMKLGYAWKSGPFELIDKLGVNWVIQQFVDNNMTVPSILEHARGKKLYRIETGHLQYIDLDGNYTNVVRRPGILLLADIKRHSQPIAKNASAALWDIGDGVACLEFTSKMNSLDIDIIKMIGQSIDIVKERYKALVIYNEGSNFSAGANLGMALFAANVGLWADLENLIRRGQQTYKDLKYSPFPVVAAPSGMALGGGCEILLHADAIQAHSELYCGLVEVGVGIIPAWGGCKEMLIRWLSSTSRAGGAMVALGKVFEMIGTAKVAKSAVEARDMMILRPGDGITMNRERLLADAKAKALELVPGYQPPVPQTLSLPGGMARVAFSLAVKALVKTGKASAYDEIVCSKLAFILSGGDTDITDKINEDDISKLEIDKFMELIHQPQTWARMEHILATGKPLRN